jgi:hypothetical protein
MMMYVLKRAIQTKKPFYSAKNRAWSEAILARAVIIREAQVKEAGVEVRTCQNADHSDSCGDVT